MRLENALDLVLEIRKIKRFFDKAADPLEFEKGLHGRTGAREHDHRGLSEADLFLKIVVTVGAKFPEIRQSVLTLGNTNIEKHAIGLSGLGLPEPFRTFICGQDLVMQTFKLCFNDLTDVIFVVDNQNTLLIL